MIDIINPINLINLPSPVNTGALCHFAGNIVIFFFFFGGGVIYDSFFHGVFCPLTHWDVKKDIWSMEENPLQRGTVTAGT